ncbi:MAG: helix-turn-helix domain-containing protein [Planctomycetes bacterium]|nr:helix-turn-helix domain-containing protein [Planctomycetota bacterium]
MLDIGLEVKILRERLKIPAKDLAEKIGLSQSQVSRLEKGQRRVDARVLARIAEALEVDPSYFFRGGEAPAEGVIPPSDPGGVGKRIRAERRRRHISAEELADRLGVTKVKILGIEEGKRPLDPELADRLCKTLHLPANYFLVHQGRTIERLQAQVTRLEQALAEQSRGGSILFEEGRPGVRGIPVLGQLASGYPGTFDALGQPTAEAEEFVYLPCVGQSPAFALYVVGDSMHAATQPSFSEGDLVVFSGSALRSRDFSFVRLRDEPPTFRQVFFDPGGLVRLQPLNLNYPAVSHAREAVLGLWRLVAHVARY